MLCKVATSNLLFSLLPQLRGEEAVEYFLVCSIIFFLLVSVTFFIMIMFSRSVKISNEKTTELFRPECEKILMELLFDDIDINTLLQKPILQECLSDIFLRSVLLDELLKLRENFDGEHAAKLELFYNQAGLLQDSLDRLRQNKWYTKCKAIKELTQMNVHSAFAETLKYTKHKNQVLRREAQLSAVKLEGFKGLSFVDGYTEYISEWEQMNFISLLNTLTDEAPDFCQWLNSGNETVKTFALRLIIHFNQVTTIPAVVPLLTSSSNEFVLIAIQALIRFQEVQYIDTLINLYGKRNNNIDIAILKALAALGNETNLPFLTQHISSSAYEIKFNSIRAINAIKGPNSEELKTLSNKDIEVEAIVNHINDVRIYE